MSARAVSPDRFGQSALNADVIDDQSLFLAVINAVDSGNRLDQRVFAHILVQIHRVQSRHVKSRQPHIDDDCDFKVGFDVFELPRQFFLVVLFQHGEQSGFIVFVVRHHKLDLFHRLQVALVRFGQHGVFVGFFGDRPVGAQSDNGFVKSVSDFPIGANEHRFAGNRRVFGDAGFVVGDKVLRHRAQTIGVT